MVGSLGPWITQILYELILAPVGGLKGQPTFLIKSFVGSPSQNGLLVVSNDLQGLLTPEKDGLGLSAAAFYNYDASTTSSFGS
jgi:hypothetical protein